MPHHMQAIYDSSQSCLYAYHPMPQQYLVQVYMIADLPHFSIPTH